jgi:hypothetical protein
MPSCRRSLGSTLLAVFVLGSGPAQTQETAPGDFPGMQLRARLETHLEGQREALKSAPTHYTLVFELAQPDLLAFMEQLQVYWDGSGYVLGVAYGPESHGGGVLALLLDAWRPAGRRARLGDAFLFEANRRTLDLEKIYRSHKHQVFLPVPGRKAGSIAGELPTTPQLPRMRFRYWTAEEPFETDAYRFLGVLLALESNPSATWTNHLGQELSLELLLQSARERYLTQHEIDAETEDHSRLHLVELLLASARRQGHGADDIKRRFLEVELAREAFEGEDGSEALAHYVESLGVLLADPSVSWKTIEKEQVKAWLLRLERDSFRDLGAVPLQHQAHLLRGLRLIDTHRDRLG